LSELEAHGVLAQEAGGLVRPKGRSAGVDAETSELASAVKTALEAGKFQPPSPLEIAAKLGRAPKDVARVIELLVDRGEAHAIQKGEIYLAHVHWDAARAAIVRNCEQNKSLDIPSLRDELPTTRQFLIPLLEHFDAQGLTLRQAGNRVLKRR